VVDDEAVVAPGDVVPWVGSGEHATTNPAASSIASADHVAPRRPIPGQYTDGPTQGGVLRNMFLET
jgi:hypothetical protein